jgi:hypothetical protein
LTFYVATGDIGVYNLCVFPFSFVKKNIGYSVSFDFFTFILLLPIPPPVLHVSFLAFCIH